MSDAPFVLFVCLHGSAKSVIASEHFRRLASERGLAIDTASAGTEPDAELPEKVVQGLRHDGISTDGLRPRAATRDDIERASLVVAFGCDLTPLAPKAKTFERWDDVPAVSEGYDRARDVIVARVRGLVGALAD
jgi:protein-tyrosine-phosphatase